MDFGDILDEWDKSTAKPCGKKKIREDERRIKTNPSGSAKEENRKPHPVDVWLRRYGTEDKDGVSTPVPEESPAEKRRRFHAMKCEAVVDLHGLTRDEAWARLEIFFGDARKRGLRKVLIIHGKGTHSEGGAVLNQLVRLFIEQNPYAGESGYSPKEEGGTGSTWVLLKDTSKN